MGALPLDDQPAAEAEGQDRVREDVERVLGSSLSSRREIHGPGSARRTSRVAASIVWSDSVRNRQLFGRSNRPFRAIPAPREAFMTR
jgi:hypothetical protein